MMSRRFKPQRGRTDPDVKRMSHGERGRELMRVRNLLRTFFATSDNSKCWHNEPVLAGKTLPEKPKVGRMNLPKPVLRRNCDRYIDRQQCFKRGCTRSPIRLLVKRPKSSE